LIWNFLKKLIVEVSRTGAVDHRILARSPAVKARVLIMARFLRRPWFYDIGLARRVD